MGWDDSAEKINCLGDFMMVDMTHFPMSPWTNLAHGGQSQYLTSPMVACRDRNFDRLTGQLTSQKFWLIDWANPFWLVKELLVKTTKIKYFHWVRSANLLNCQWFSSFNPKNVLFWGIQTSFWHLQMTPSTKNSHFENFLQKTTFDHFWPAKNFDQSLTSHWPVKSKLKIPISNLYSDTLRDW